VTKSLPRDFEVGNPSADESTTLIRRRCCLGAQDHCRRDILAQGRVGYCKGNALCYRRVFSEDVVDFQWGDFLTTAIDNLVATAEEKQVSVIVKKAEIARLEPFTHKRSLVRRRVAVIAGHDRCTTNDNFSRLAARQRSISFAKDRYIQSHWDPD
jgi:hypothetical protein